MGPCTHLEQGIYTIIEGLEARRAKQPTHYSWLCQDCGHLWIGFNRQSSADSAAEELEAGQ